MTPGIRIRRNDEARIQDEIIGYLRKLEWLVKVCHGNAYQSGMPDLFASHARFGQRWIEVKNPIQFSFTAAQLIDFPQFVAHGAPIWVLTQASDEEYKKLFKPCNFMEYYICACDGVTNIEAWRQGRRK